MSRKFDNIIFPDPLILKYPVGAGKTLGVKDWHLEADFRIFWTDNDVEQHYTAKAGLITDMSSIPWWAQGLPGMQKAGRKVRASLIHDDIYEKRPLTWPREDADHLLYHGWRASGVHWIPARGGYRAVRLGGRHAWET